MYIEDIKTSRIALEFEIKYLNDVKHYVHQNKVGTVFVGSSDQCREYIKQRRAKKAIQEAERGMNPFFTR